MDTPMVDFLIGLDEKIELIKKKEREVGYLTCLEDLLRDRPTDLDAWVKSRR